MNSHAGQNLDDLPLVFGPFPAYTFSKSLNWLSFDPTYSTNPATLGEYIRKYRKDKGISQVELAERLRVNEMTIVNWETMGMVPAKRHMEMIARSVEGAERFLFTKISDGANIGHESYSGRLR